MTEILTSAWYFLHNIDNLLAFEFASLYLIFHTFLFYACVSLTYFLWITSCSNPKYTWGLRVASGACKSILIFSSAFFHFANILPPLFAEILEDVIFPAQSVILILIGEKLAFAWETQGKKFSKNICNQNCRIISFLISTCWRIYALESKVHFLCYHPSSISSLALTQSLGAPHA